MSAAANSMTSLAILNREFFEMRARLLELAASFDRLDRAVQNLSGQNGAQPDLADDQRMQRIRAALDVLASPGPDRAEQIQLIFSRAYDDDWQEKFFEQV